MNLPKYVCSREGKQTGKVVGKRHRCQLAGCNGIPLAVRWPDGKLTYPCSRGMQEVSSDTWRIG